jgi:predicted signal transduction protein with EAL and GGDEF domain
MDKRIGPTVVVVVLVFFILVQAGAVVYALTKEGLGPFWITVIILIPLMIIAVLIGVYIERIREIDQEDKDDLSRY